MRNFLLLVLAAIAAPAFGESAERTVYKCTSADGAVSYTNTACPTGAASDVMLTYKPDAAKAAPVSATPSSDPVAYADYLKRTAPPVHTQVSRPPAPAGAKAQCNDGTYAFGTYRRGACTRHGGVAKWL